MPAAPVRLIASGASVTPAEVMGGLWSSSGLTVVAFVVPTVVSVELVLLSCWSARLLLGTNSANLAGICGLFVEGQDG
jgi:hypothetical protein